MTTATVEQIQATIEQEINADKIVVYSKGTKEAPRCGFTMQTREFFNGFGYPFTFIDVLDDPEKRQVLAEMTDWPTLPKVFIGGQFYGDGDVLIPMAEKGELQTLLKQTFGE